GGGRRECHLGPLPRPVPQDFLASPSLYTSLEYTSLVSQEAFLCYNRPNMSFQPPFTDVPDALEEIRAGRMIVVVDDEDRENEGDLTLAAEKVTPEAITFMAKE